MKPTLEQKIDLILEKVSSHDDRFTHIDDRFSQMDDRFSQMDDRFTHIDDRFSQMDDRFDLLAMEMVVLRDDVDGLKTQMGKLTEQVSDGFGKLDEFVHELQRHDQETVANRAAIERHETRLERLEKTA